MRAPLLCNRYAREGRGLQGAGRTTEGLRWVSAGHGRGEGAGNRSPPAVRRSARPWRTRRRWLLQSSTIHLHQTLENGSLSGSSYTTPRQASFWAVRGPAGVSFRHTIIYWQRTLSTARENRLRIFLKNKSFRLMGLSRKSEMTN